MTINNITKKDKNNMGGKNIIKSKSSGNDRNIAK